MLVFNVKYKTAFGRIRTCTIEASGEYEALENCRSLTWCDFGSIVNVEVSDKPPGTLDRKA